MMPSVYPTPKTIELGTGTFKLGEGIEIRVDPRTYEEQRSSLHKVADLICDRHAICRPVKIIEIASATFRCCALTPEHDFPSSALRAHGAVIQSLRPEGYVLSVEQQGALVASQDARGMLYGLHSLISALKQAPIDTGVPQQQIVDWPHKPLRGVHLYLPARVDLPFARTFAKEFLVPLGYNTVFLEVGAGLRFDRHPEVNQGFTALAHHIHSTGKRPLGIDGRFQNSPHAKVAGGRFLEKEELRRLVDDLEALHLDVIPEIPSLTHSYYLVAAHRELAEMPEAPWPDAYCPSNPKTYDLLFDLADEILEVFTPRAVHIGHDEWRCAAKCPRCRHRPAHDLLVEDVTRIYDFYRDRGIEQVFMWGDLLIKAHNGLGASSREGEVWYDFPVTWQAQDRLPKDIVMFNWGYAGNPSRPEMIRGAGELKEAGYRQILGNFQGEDVPDALRTFWWDDPTVLGAEVSTWVGFNEFDLAQAGLMEKMTSSAQVFWAGTRRALPDFDRKLPVVLSESREDLQLAASRQIPSPALARDVTKDMMPLDLAPAANVPATVLDAGGNRHRVTLPCSIEAPRIPLQACQREGTLWAVSIAREGDVDRQTTLPAGIRCGSLAFFHSTDAPGGSIRIPDGPTLPYEPMALYLVEYEDGQIEPISVVYHLNVLEGSTTYPEPLYYNLPPVEIAAGDQTIAISCYEWVNPWPNKRIRSIHIKPVLGSSDAKLLLWGITGVSLRG